MAPQSALKRLPGETVEHARWWRTLIADVTLLPEQRPDHVRIGIRWHTGTTSELTAGRPVHPSTAKRSPDAAVELIKPLGPATRNDDLVRQLSAAAPGRAGRCNRPLARSR